jgi:electron transfer flavoprotein alpha subunit
MKDVLVFAESHDGILKKGAFEVVSFGRRIADALGGQCHVLALGSVNHAGELGRYGAHAVHHNDNSGFDSFDDRDYTNAVAAAAKSLGAGTVVLGHTANGRTIHGRLAVKLDAGAVSGVNKNVDTSDGFVASKGVFSGKATSSIKISSPMRVLSLMGNSVAPEIFGEPVTAQSIDLPAPQNRVQVIERQTVSGIVPLPEAELVVSAGRGMKGPENWSIIEELAEELGATTACSRPVADSGWRPHHEHVGQTGVAIRPNLYIAAGISGAIQHLAGVNNSKVIVVINKDAEAPFFKAANYGVCADLFDVVPRITAALKKFKAS